MAEKTKTMFETHIDLSKDKRAELIELLNAQLADTFDLFSQTKQAHWNVKGMDFIQLHKFFDEAAALLLGYVDMIAERANALGGEPRGTVRMAAANTTLDEYPEGTFDGEPVVRALAERWGAYAASTREAGDKAEKIGDMATNDLFIEVQRGVDKYLWFLDGHLQG